MDVDEVSGFLEVLSEVWGSLVDASGPDQGVVDYTEEFGGPRKVDGRVPSPDHCRVSAPLARKEESSRSEDACDFVNKSTVVANL